MQHNPLSFLLPSVIAEILQNGQHFPLKLDQVNLIDHGLLFRKDTSFGPRRALPSWSDQVYPSPKEWNTKTSELGAHLLDHLHLGPVNFHVESLQLFQQLFWTGV